MLIHFDRIHKGDRQMDGQTTQQHRLRLCIASCRKKPAMPLSKLPHIKCISIIKCTRPRRRRFEALTTDAKIIRLIRQHVAFFPTAVARQFFNGDYC